MANSKSGSSKRGFAAMSPEKQREIAAKGGRVLADWPGLASANLLEGRDLKPTLALDALIAAVCAEVFQLEPERAARVLFPAAARGRFPTGMLRA